jgi:TPR repeat protein
LLFLYGHGVPKNLLLAQSYFERALEGNHPHARLALLRAKILLRNKNDKSADNWSELGQSYIQSLVAADYLHALCCFEEAVRINSRHITANANLGKMYFCGYGVNADLEKAKKYLTVASVQGCDDSQTILALIKGFPGMSKTEAIPKWYERGCQCWEQKKHQEAKFCFEQIATLDSDHIHANYNLGILYFSVDKNYSRAKEYFDKSDQNGHPEARNMSIKAGLYKKHGVLNFKQWNDAGCRLWGEAKYDDARYCFEESLKLNPKYASANSNLGNVYFYGRGADRDLQAAKKYFEVAKAYGLKVACEKLVKIKMYSEKDKPAADDWYRLASEYYSNDPVCDEVTICLTEANRLDDKHPDVNYLVGCILYYGHGRDKDFENAKRHFLVAAESGLVKAQEMLEMIELCLENIDLSGDEWYAKGISYHQHGRNQLAFYCFEQAASHQHAHAKLMQLQMTLSEHRNDIDAQEILSPYFGYQSGDICLTENQKRVLEDYILKSISRSERVILSLDVDDTIIFNQSTKENIIVNIRLVHYIAHLLATYGVENFEFQILTARKPDPSPELVRIHASISEAKSAFFAALCEQLRSMSIDDFEDHHLTVPDEHVYCLGALIGKYTQLSYDNARAFVFHENLTGDALHAYIENERAKFAEHHRVDAMNIEVKALSTRECQLLNKQMVMRDIFPRDRFFRIIHFDDRFEHVTEVPGVPQTAGIPLWSPCKATQSYIIDLIIEDIKQSYLCERQKNTAQSPCFFKTPQECEASGAAYAPGLTAL